MRNVKNKYIDTMNACKGLCSSPALFLLLFGRCILYLPELNMHTCAVKNDMLIWLKCMAIVEGEMKTLLPLQNICALSMIFI